MKKLVRVGILFVSVFSLLAGAGTPPVNAQTTLANGRIFYDQKSEDYLTGYSHIFSIGPDGSDNKQITANAQEMLYERPSVSPDGNKIAYMSMDASVTLPTYYISVSNADGAEARTLVPAADHMAFAFPSWTPDGSKVVYLSYSFYTNKLEVHTININGSNDQTLPIDINVSSFEEIDGPVSWSVNNVLAFVDNGNEIYTINPDGSNKVNLTTEPEWDEASFGELAWSPDGSKIAFSVGNGCNENNHSCIEIMNADGSNKTFVVGDTMIGEDWLVTTHPTWSPDGTKLAFSKRRAIKG
ncbi:MAG TPA: hypothetical protein VMR45_05105 [Patescibacteria group bacterium]|nr:hypothetical protein [Patescibacteria group bacterium]